MIELKGISKTYSSQNGQVVALKNIDLKIEDGEIFGIIGLSGAGKSTLVRCINLLEKPTEGSVFIDGEDITKASGKRLREVRKNIGMIFQGFNLLQQRTIAGNIRFPMEISGVGKAEANKRVEELLEVVGLSGRARDYPSQLSGGQKQRVAIARALALNPKYLLCDEATSALDPTTTESILELLEDINRKLNVTIIVITHEMKVVEKICTKVAVLDKSEIAECGDVSEIFADPKSQIAKELILPNLISAERQSEGVEKIRLIFKGDSLDKPIISGLAMECGIMVSILYADTKTIEGKAYGHMVVELPKEEDKKALVREYLNKYGVAYREEF